LIENIKWSPDTNLSILEGEYWATTQYSPPEIEGEYWATTQYSPPEIKGDMDLLNKY
jgi:hypothetical protein